MQCKIKEVPLGDNQLYASTYTASVSDIAGIEDTIGLPLVMGHGRQLQQPFQNITGNAIKYSKRDVPPQISITSTQAGKDDKLYFLIRIKDNGIGFDQGYAEKIFGMFTRRQGKSGYSGTGWPRH